MSTRSNPCTGRNARCGSRAGCFAPDCGHPPATYLHLRIDNLRLTWRFGDMFLPITAARRLRDQLTAHLDVVDSRPTTPFSASVVDSMP